MPESIRELGPQTFDVSLEKYREFWKKSNDKTSCYPDSMSFATMKASASSEIASKLDCMMANIPLKGGFAPERWQKCINVMIMKRSGVTHLSGLRTIILFLVDCNYVFKHIGREMMAVAEKTKTISLWVKAHARALK